VFACHSPASYPGESGRAASPCARKGEPPDALSRRRSSHHEPRQRGRALRTTRADCFPTCRGTLCAAANARPPRHTAAERHGRRPSQRLHRERTPRQRDPRTRHLDRRCEDFARTYALGDAPRRSDRSERCRRRRRADRWESGSSQPKPGRSVQLRYWKADAQRRQSHDWSATSGPRHRCAPRRLGRERLEISSPRPPASRRDVIARLPRGIEQRGDRTRPH
jgi:hypothetical protein